MTFASNEDFAEKYRKFMIRVADTGANLYNMSNEDFINELPSATEIVSDIVNQDTGYLRDMLLDVKKYYNDNYDEQDPDWAATLLSCELLIGYLDI